MSDNKILLETKSWKKYFHTPAGELHAVDSAGTNPGSRGGVRVRQVYPGQDHSEAVGAEFRADTL